MTTKRVSLPVATAISKISNVSIITRVKRSRTKQSVKRTTVASAVFVNINMNGKRGEHDCTQRYCSICKEMGSIDHQYFIKPVEDSNNDESSQHADAGRSTDGDCRADEKKKAEKEVAKYVFFDFECTQDDGVHVPNLCVARVVCEFCAERSENDMMYKSCKHCSHLCEKIFKGDKCKQEF